MWASKVPLQILLVIISLECAFSIEPKRIITVHGPYGQTTNFLYRRNTTVADLKRAISERFFIPAINQRLLIDKTELVNDKDLLFSHKIWRWPTIEVEEQNEEFVFDLQIKASGERIGQVQAEPSLSIAQLKKKIFFILGFHPETINYPTEDDPLEDNHRLAQLDIATNQVNLYVTGTKSHAELRVDTSRGWSFSVDINPEHTVGHLKSIVEHRLDLPTKDQKLYLAGAELNDDNKLLSDYQIWLYESINLDMGTFRPMRRLMFVGHDGSRFSESLEVYVDETIDNIRAKAAQLLRIPKNEIILGKSIDRHGNEVLFEGSYLSDYYDPSVDPSDVKMMELPARQLVYVSIKLENGSELWSRIEKFKTILNFKNQIMLEHDIQSDGSSMHLFLLDSELVDYKSFSDYGLGYYVKLDLKVNDASPMLRIVSFIDNETLDVNEISDLTTVQDLKKFIEGEWGIPTEFQRLFCINRELPNDQKLKLLNLPSGTDIYLATRPGQELEYLLWLSNLKLSFL